MVNSLEFALYGGRSLPFTGALGRSASEGNPVTRFLSALDSCGPSVRHRDRRLFEGSTCWPNRRLAQVYVFLWRAMLPKMPFLCAMEDQVRALAEVLIDKESFGDDLTRSHDELAESGVTGRWSCLPLRCPCFPSWSDASRDGGR